MIIYIKDFTQFPGARFKQLGPFSGEEFRDDYLLPAIEKYDSDVQINLDGVFGYGSSFLEEIFGGAVRKGCSKETIRAIVNNLVSDDDPDLIDEIDEYVKDAISII